MNAKLTFAFVPAALLALAATGLVTKTEPAMAQQAAEQIEEIIVQAPFVRREVGKSGTSGAKIEVVELRRRVSYADLDLSMEADVTELETRIETIAKEACDQLSEMFPLSKMDRVEKGRCIKGAIADTEVQVEAAIAAAN